MLCAGYQYLCLFIMIVKNRKITWCLNFIEIIYNASLSHKDKNIQWFKQFWNWRLQIFYSFSCNFWFQSFTIPDRFISAQFPLPDYTEDFLRLVEAYYTPTIVSLCPLMEVESVKNLTIYTKWKNILYCRNLQIILSLLKYYSR